MTVKKWQRLWESKMAGSFLWELIKKRKLFPAKSGSTLREADAARFCGYTYAYAAFMHFVERSVKLFDCTSVEEMLAAAKKRLGGEQRSEADLALLQRLE